MKAAAANPDSAMDLLLTLGPLAKKVALHKAKGVLLLMMEVTLLLILLMLLG